MTFFRICVMCIVSMNNINTNFAPHNFLQNRYFDKFILYLIKNNSLIIIYNNVTYKIITTMAFL